MKVLLLTNVRGTGNKGEIKEVADGYALNCLIPEGKARQATDSVVKKAQTEKEAREEKEAKNKERVVATLESINGKRIEIEEKANEKGNLYHGIDAKTIAEIINREYGPVINDSHIILESPVKEVGEHTIEIENYGKKITIVFVVKGK